MKYAKYVTRVRDEDCLGSGDVPLKDGERLRIRYPTGAEENVIVELYNTAHFDSYMSCMEAFFFTKHEGVRVRIPLAGMLAERIR